MMLNHHQEPHKWVKKVKRPTTRYFFITTCNKILYGRMCSLWFVIRCWTVANRSTKKKIFWIKDGMEKSGKKHTQQQQQELSLIQRVSLLFSFVAFILTAAQVDTISFDMSKYFILSAFFHPLNCTIFLMYWFCFLAPFFCFLIRLRPEKKKTEEKKKK